MGLDNPLHIAFLLIVLLLVFGARRLPEIGRSIGTGMREFKDSISGDSSHAHTLAQSTQQPQAVAQPVAQAPAQQPAPVAPAQPAQAPAEPTPQA
ncbi:MAG TPA: twin-arginine translocase TatA/TatE family subunit [Solirubrobacteraceae bacterium]|nr:twin-arginine translocase TatA/TatE family subunit [Solirubrobacteraceae bacterium]